MAMGRAPSGPNRPVSYCSTTTNNESLPSRSLSPSLPSFSDNPSQPSSSPVPLTSTPEPTSESSPTSSSSPPPHHSPTPATIKAGTRQPPPKRHSRPFQHHTNDWQFDRSEFAKFNNTYGPFTLDACSDSQGQNSHVTTFCSPDNSVLSRDLAGETVWCNPPISQASSILKHYLECKAKSPDKQTSALFVLHSQDLSWLPLVRHMALVKKYAPGTTLFQPLPSPDRPEHPLPRSVPWIVRVYYDAPESLAVPALTDYNAKISAQLAPAHVEPQLNSLTTNSDTSPPPDLQPPTLIPPEPPDPPSPNSPSFHTIYNLSSAAAGIYDQPLLILNGTINGKSAKVLIDSGSMIDAVSTRWLRKQPSPEPLQPLKARMHVRLANGAIQAAKHCLQANMTLTGTDLLSDDCPRFFRELISTDIEAVDVVLGKPWLNTFNPQFNWPANTIVSPWHLTASSSSISCPSVNHISAKHMAKTLRNPSVQPFYGLVTPSTNESSDTPAPDPFKPEATSLSPSNLPRLHATLDRFRTLFSEPSGLNDVIPTHRIHLQPGAKPPQQRTYRMSPAQLAEVQKQLASYIDKGWVRPSSSEFGAPVIFAAKADGSLRFCVDYRALNAITIKDRYPLPRVDELLDQLYGAKYFTSLDLWQGYHQCRIHPDDIHKTAFRTRYGQFEFTVLPFGLTNAPSSFMRLMNNVLSEYLDSFVVVYLDDVLIYSKTEEEHLQHINMVLSKLEAANLHVKMSKCKFAQPSTPFLGFLVTSDGLKVNPSKISAVADWAPPQDLTAVRAWLGFTGFYRRFVKDYAKIAAPLTDLTKTTAPFPSSLPPAALEAFNALKLALTTAPVLVIPFTGPDATFELYTDASGKGLGAVLLQDQGKGPQPVYYESRKMTPAEMNYPVHEQELLGVVYACTKFRHYLDGCLRFTLYTDHHSLQFFFTQRDLSKRQARWSQTLAPFQPNMDIKYRPGPENQVDALSRLFSLGCTIPTCSDHASQLINDLLAIFPDATLVLDDDIPSSIAAAYSSDPLYAPDNNRRPGYLSRHHDE